MQINLTVEEIKRIIGTQCSPDDSFFNSELIKQKFIKSISSLEQATKNDLAVFLDRGDESVFSPMSVDKIKNSKAGLIITNEKLVEGKNYLIVDDPLKAFTLLVNYIQNKSNSGSFVHATSIVSEGVDLEDNVKIEAYVVIKNNTKVGKSSFIGAHSFIGKDCVIGSNVKMYPNVKILDGCKIGNNCIIHSGTVIGSDGFGYSVTKAGLKKIPQVGIVEIGNDVEIGACCSIDRASFDKTVISDGVKLDNHVHIAHNVHIGSHTVIIAQTGIAGGAQIGAGCQIGGQVAIRDHIKIGNGVKIVSKSAVLKDLKDGEIVAGIPTVSFNQWKRISVIVTKLPEFIKEFSKLRALAENIKNKKGFFKRFWG